MGLDISAVDPNTQEDRAEARLGDVGFIHDLRSLLAEYPDQFPMILQRVIFSAAHCGDEIYDPDIMRVIAEECVLLEDQFGNNARVKRFAGTLKAIAETAIAENLILVF